MESEKASQGKVTGVIIPPPEIRAVVDRTAQFVGKNGKSFEQRILGSAEGKTAKFNFMKQFDPYHAYYEQKIRETEEAIARGETIEKPKAAVAAPVDVPKQEEPKTAPVTQSVTTAVKATLQNPIARIIQKKSTDVPTPFEFIIPTPVGLTAEDIDIIKLTAQYTAANGRDFLAGIAMREQRNPQFHFLKPTHMLFSYFTSLVDSYMKVISPSAELLKKIQTMSVQENVLESTVQRWDYNKREEARKRSESSQNDEDRLAFQQIDWFDFAVVETIDFPEDEMFDIPGMAGLGMYDINGGTSNGTSKTTNGHATTATAVTANNNIMPPPAPVAPPRFTVAPPPPPPSAPSAPSQAPQAPVYAMPTDEDDSELKIVSNYVPRIAGTGSSNTTSNMTMVDPISGKMIPIDQMEEHMRVQLLDPKWREEQKRFIEKQKETGYAEGVSIADSLKNFAKKRGDIFGQAAVGTGADSAAAIAQEEKIEQARYADSVQWDGHYGSIGSANEQKANQTASFAARGLLPPPPSNLPPAIGPSLTAPVAPSLPTFAPPPPAMMQFNMPAPPQVMPAIPAMPAFPGYGFVPPVPVMPVIPGMVVPPPPPMMAAAMGLAPGLDMSGTGEPSAKKAKVEAALMSPEEFAVLNPYPITLQITLPMDLSPQGTAWNLGGQTLTLSNLAIQTTVKDIKEMLATQYLGGMPLGKQQLKSANLGFLKDTSSLAFYNITDNSTIELSVKTRSGKK